MVWYVNYARRLVSVFVTVSLTSPSSKIVSILNPSSKIQYKGDFIKKFIRLEVNSQAQQILNHHIPHHHTRRRRHRKKNNEEIVLNGRD